MFPIYTVGYRTLNPRDLFEYVKALGPANGCGLPGKVMDIRYLQESGNRAWQRQALQQQFGYDYFPNSYLGNRTVGRGGIQIHKPKIGIRTVIQFAEWQPLALMCACEDYGSCHRAVVSRLLETRSIQTEEIRRQDIPSAPPPPGCTKTISLWPFWALLLAHGFMSVEKRAWPDAYRGPLLIHATGWSGMQKAGESPSQWFDFYKAEMNEMGYSKHTELPTGAIVGIGHLRDVFQLDPHGDPRISSSEERYGDCSAGHWGWRFDQVTALKNPFKVAGRQLLWDCPVEIKDLS